MNVVICLGGSVVASPKINKEYIKEFSSLIKKFLSIGYRFIIVVGGGDIAREYINIARELSNDETLCDKVGIMVTRMNAMLLISALKGYAYEDVITDTKGLKFEDKVKILGGTVPGQTTDSVAAEAARESRADLLIYVTNVDGIYDKDPQIYKDARLIKRMKFEDLVNYSIREHKAGIRGVIDYKAAMIIKENRIKTIFLNGKDIKNIEKALLGEEVGTLIS